MKSSISLVILAGLLVQSYALPPTSARKIVQRTNVAPTQYHATCADSAEEIRQAIDNKALALLPDRRWPDEFSWSGGFYLTPKREIAEAYGAIYLTRCLEANRGGVVVMEMGFDKSKLSVMPGIQGETVGAFR
ncbi:hypothetical protein C8J57DRAFT_1509617 [Mycena rebaudengoi]|nr:hypothetical protein C8J57DRAFT_1509617 [Mycena rebaudengoi]